MHVSRGARLLIPGLLAIGLLLGGAGVGCGDDGAETADGAKEDGDDGVSRNEIEDVVYGGIATDEALLDLLAATPSDAPAGGFTSPAEGEVLPPTGAATFAFSATGQSALRVTPSSGEGLSGAPSRIEVAFTSGLSYLLAGVPEAEAHGDPTNGTAYFLVFTSSSGEVLLRIFTTETTFTPDEAAWGRLVSAGTVTASLTYAEFESNRVSSGGGPFRVADRHFTIQ